MEHWIDTSEFFTKHTPLAAHCDYLTVTTKDKQLAFTLENKIDKLAREFEDRRYMPQNWSENGFVGFAIGDLRFGAKDDVVMARVAGKAAHLAAWEFAELPVRCTRFDVALTYKLPKRYENLAVYFWNKWHQMKKKSTSPSEARLVRSFTGQTFYLGRRDSSMFVRLYDKGGHEGYDLGHLWRLEFEMKKSKAAMAWMTTVANRFDVGDMYELCRLEANKVGLFLQPLANVQLDISSLEIEAATYETTLSWLRTTVRPAILRLAKAGLQLEVQGALGLPEHEIVSRETLADKKGR